MLTLPPGQGFSIYSIAAVLPLLAAKQRMTHPNDWMTSDAEIACPDPNCASRLRIVRTRQAPLLACRDDRGAARRIGQAVTMRASRPSRRAMRSRASSGAAGSLPAGMARSTATWPSTTSSRLSMPASPPSTAPTSTPASRRCMAGCARASSTSRAGRRRPAQGSHQVRAGPRAPATRGPCLYRGHHRRVAAPARDGAARPRSVPLVGLWRRALARRLGWLAEMRRAGKIDRIGATNFDTPARRNSRCRHSARLDAGSVFPPRPPRRALAPTPAVQRGVDLFCYGTVAGGFLGERWLGAPEPRRRSKTAR